MVLYAEPLGKGFDLSYPDKETILRTVDPDYGNIN